MEVTLAGAPVTAALAGARLAQVSLEFAAFDGEVGIGQLPIPDTDAALALATGRQALVEEGSTLLVDGFMIDQDRVRARARGEPDFTLSVMDANALLAGFRVSRSRPSETDYARVIAFAALDGPTWDTTWVLNSSTVTLPAKRYDSDGGWRDLITDLVEFTGKTLFLHDKAGGGRCLHYHVLTTGHTSGLEISDVTGAADEATIWAPIAPARHRTSVDLRNDVLGKDQAGRTSHQSDGTSISSHDADGLQHQALVNFDASSQADLDAKTTAFLASQKADTDTYTCAIGPLGEDELAQIRVGDLIPVTSAVMGLSASVQRISHMTLRPITPWQWIASLELGAPIRRRARVKPRAVGVIPPLPYVLPCLPLRETFTRTVASGWGPSEFDGESWDAAVGGSVASVNGTEGRLQPTGGTHATQVKTLPLTYPLHVRTLQRLVTNNSATLTWFFAQYDPEPGPPGGIGSIAVSGQYIDAGDGGPSFRLQTTIIGGSGGTGGAFSAPLAGDASGQDYWIEFIATDSDISVRCWYDGDAEPAYTVHTVTPADPIELPDKLAAIASGTAAAADWRVLLIEILCDPAPDYSYVANEFVMVGDDVRTTATLQRPYVPGTVRIQVDGIPEPVGETDPATGAITLPYTPAGPSGMTAAETVTASYQVAP